MPRRSSLFIDTSGWACLLNRNDPLHAQVRALYEGVLRRKGRLVTTNLVLIELVPLLASRTRISRKEIFAYIDSLRAAPFLTMVRIDEQTENAAWDMLKQYGDKEWSVVDACSFLVMRQLGIAEALTTDQHFISTPGRRWYTMWLGH